MSKLTTRKDISKISILFMITYMVSYITRINYGAIISEMVEATAVSKSLLSLALTGSFVTYGVGQIISGICGDKFHPKKLVGYGLIVSIIMNLLIPLAPGYRWTLVIWSVNGFAQAFMWPPIVKLMTELFSAEDYKKACVIVSRGSAAGTIVIYLLSPVLISLAGWKSVFILSALSGIIMVGLWFKMCPDVEFEMTCGGNGHNTAKTQTVKNETPNLFAPVMLGIMLAIVLQGILRDGVTTWMPSYISETYQLGSAISILTGVVLPIFSMVCYQLALNLYQKKFRNPLQCSGVIFGAGAISALALFLLSDANAASSVLFSAVLTGCMHGVNLILITMIPHYFSKYGNVSTVSGLLNSCTYIGSAISSYGMALLAENQGWKFTILVWFLVALAGTIVCMVCVKPWKNSQFGKDD